MLKDRSAPLPLGDLKAYMQMLLKALELVHGQVRGTGPGHWKSAQEERGGGGSRRE